MLRRADRRPRRACRRRAGCRERPVRSGIHVAHPEFEADEGEPDAARRKRRAASSYWTMRCSPPPTPARRDVNWMDSCVRASCAASTALSSPPDNSTSESMYSVTKKIEFCYGHRLSTTTVSASTPRPQRRGGDRGAERVAGQPQHGVRLLRHQARDQGMGRSRARSQDDSPRDDPLVGPLQRLGEPVFVVQSNPTVEHIAKLLYDYTHSQGFPVVRVTVWETPTSFATYGGDGRSTFVN